MEKQVKEMELLDRSICENFGEPVITCLNRSFIYIYIILHYITLFFLNSFSEEIPFASFCCLCAAWDLKRRQRGRKTNNENLLKAVASRRTKLGLDDKPWSFNRVGLERAGGHKFKFSYNTVGAAMEQLQVENKDTMARSFDTGQVDLK